MFGSKAPMKQAVAHELPPRHLLASVLAEQSCSSSVPYSWERAKCFHRRRISGSEEGRAVVESIPCVLLEISNSPLQPQVKLEKPTGFEK